MSSDLQTRLSEAEKSFKKACEQIVQLNRRLDEMAKRYDKASRENHRSFRYSLRLRMAVSEGVRNMYYEYAANKADVITNLRCQVLQAVGEDNQASAPTDREEVEERVEEEEGNEEDSNPIVDFEDVGDILDNQVLNNINSGASDSATQDDEDEDHHDQDPLVVVQQEVQGIAVAPPMVGLYHTHSQYESSDTELPATSASSSGVNRDDEEENHPNISEQEAQGVPVRPCVGPSDSTDNSGLNDANEMSENGDSMQVETSYFTSDGENSRPVLTRSRSPVSEYMMTS